MAMVAAKCTECGAALNVDESKEAGICPYCNTAFITEKVIHNHVTNNVTNIGKMNIGTLNIQKSDFVTAVYFDEVDKILYGSRIHGIGYYGLPLDYCGVVRRLQKDYPNRAMTHYITAFVLLYARRDDDSEVTAGVASWENEERRLNEEIKKSDEAETTFSGCKKTVGYSFEGSREYRHCKEVNKRFSQGIGERSFCFERYEEAKRLLTSEEASRYKDFISYVDKETAAIKRCLPLFNRLIERYKADEPIENRAKKLVGEISSKALIIGVVAMIVFALICTVISSEMHKEKNDSSESSRLERIFEE